jgi:hypothetical protein
MAGSKGREVGRGQREAVVVAESALGSWCGSRMIWRGTYTDGANIYSAINHGFSFESLLKQYCQQWFLD